MSNEEINKIIGNKPIMQKPQELIQLIQFLQTQKINSIVELGIMSGGTLSVFKECFPSAIVIGVDISKPPEVKNCITIWGNSHEESTLKKVLNTVGKPDFVF